MRSILFLALLALSAIFAAAVIDETYCNTNICRVGSTCTKGQKVKVYVTLNTNTYSNESLTDPSWSNSNNVVNYVFCPKVDEFAALVLNGSQAKILDPDASMVVTTMNSTSTIRYFTDPSYPTIMNAAGFFTLVVTMYNGVLYGSTPVQFQDTCTSAGGKCMYGLGLPCIRGVDCGVDLSSTNVNATDLNGRIFIAWQGSDASGSPFTSAGLLPSRFRSFAAGNLYNQISTIELPNLSPSFD